MEYSTKFYNPKIEDCSVVIEDGNRHLLWNSWHNFSGIDWKEISIGQGPCFAGHIHNMKNLPVYIHISFAEINVNIN